MSATCYRPDRPRWAADGVLLRSLRDPLTPAEITRIRDARPAGPPPLPAAEPIRIQRRVSGRGPLVVAGQCIHVGMVRAGYFLDVEPADRMIRVYDDTGALVAEDPCTTLKSIGRVKVGSTRLASKSAGVVYR